jgi:hypothetical protein
LGKFIPINVIYFQCDERGKHGKTVKGWRKNRILPPKRHSSLKPSYSLDINEINGKPLSLHPFMKEKMHLPFIPSLPLHTY